MASQAANLSSNIIFKSSDSSKSWRDYRASPTTSPVAAPAPSALPLSSPPPSTPNVQKSPSVPNLSGKKSTRKEPIEEENDEDEGDEFSELFSRALRIVPKSSSPKVESNSKKPPKRVSYGEPTTGRVIFSSEPNAVHYVEMLREEELLRQSADAAAEAQREFSEREARMRETEEEIQRRETARIHQRNAILLRQQKEDAAIVDRDAAKYQKEAEVALEPGRMLLRILKDIEDRRRAEEKRIADAKAAAAAAAKEEAERKAAAAKAAAEAEAAAAAQAQAAANAQAQAAAAATAAAQAADAQAQAARSAAPAHQAALVQHAAPAVQAIPGIPPPTHVSPAGYASHLHYEKLVDDLTVATAPMDQHPRRADLKFEIMSNLNKVSAKIDQVKEKIGILTNLFNATKGDSMLYAFALREFAKSIVGHAQKQMAQHPSTTYPFVYVVHHVSLHHPALFEVVIAHLEDVCPYVIPMYPPRYEGEDEITHKINALKYKPGIDDDPVEDASSYTTRMKGMIGFLAALYCTTMSGQNQLNEARISMAWTWLSRILNMEPRRITADILHAFLKHSAYYLLARYKAQFQKVMTLIATQFVHKVSNEEVDAKSRLLSFCEAFYKAGGFAVPEGANIAQ